jgi:hypothetical protein
MSVHYCSHAWSKLLIPVNEGELPWGLVEMTVRWTSRLVVQEHAEQATIGRQPTVITVIDKAQLNEPIHEMTDPRLRLSGAKMEGVSEVL